jgi:hypothetical protein
MYTNAVAYYAYNLSLNARKSKKYVHLAASYAAVQAVDFITKFLGWGPLKIIHNFLSIFYKIVYFFNAVFLSGIPVYHLLKNNQQLITEDGQEILQVHSNTKADLQELFIKAKKA